MKPHEKGATRIVREFGRSGKVQKITEVQEALKQPLVQPEKQGLKQALFPPEASQQVSLPPPPAISLGQASRSPLCPPQVRPETQPAGHRKNNLWFCPLAPKCANTVGGLELQPTEQGGVPYLGQEGAGVAVGAMQAWMGPGASGNPWKRQRCPQCRQPAQGRVCVSKITSRSCKQGSWSQAEAVRRNFLPSTSPGWEGSQPGVSEALRFKQK